MFVIEDCSVQQFSASPSDIYLSRKNLPPNLRADFEIRKSAMKYCTEDLLQNAETLASAEQVGPSRTRKGTDFGKQKQSGDSKQAVDLNYFPDSVSWRDGWGGTAKRTHKIIVLYVDGFLQQNALPPDYPKGLCKHVIWRREGNSLTGCRKFRTGASVPNWRVFRGGPRVLHDGTGDFPRY